MDFAIYSAGDAYSTAQKIMGRQAAGKAFLKGVARSAQDRAVRALGHDRGALKSMASQLASDGFTGSLEWSLLPDLSIAAKAGVLYYPAPPEQGMAVARDLAGGGAFSIMGVTHTLSSHGAADRIAQLVLPPFRPWDALICTSQAAHVWVSQLHAEMRDYWSETTGASRFVDIQLPIIPLGVDLQAFKRQDEDRSAARDALGLDPRETVFLFAGRLSFHAKANPASVYLALERAAQKGPVTCVEAGIFPNEGIHRGYTAAQQALAPSVKFIWADGKDEEAYRRAWQCADVFVSLSDNIQETFGLTPVEAMAAGLPVVVSDWNGYKDTVRDGIDGIRVPTILPPPGLGVDLAIRHFLEIDTYDFFIGRTSMATVVDPEALARAFELMVEEPESRTRMGAAGLERARAQYDWLRILERYDALAAELNLMRRGQESQGVRIQPQRADPLHRFRHFSTLTLSGDWGVEARPGASERLGQLLGLTMATYAFDEQLLPKNMPGQLLASLGNRALSVNALLKRAGLASPVGVRALMWLWKFDLVSIQMDRSS